MDQHTFIQFVNSIVHNDTDRFQQLLPHVDPKNHESQALRAACNFEHMDFVRVLLPLSDPKAANSAVLRIACYMNNQEMFDLLYPHSDAEQALQYMTQQGDYGSASMLITRMNIDIERTHIHKAIDHHHPSIKRKM